MWFCIPNVAGSGTEDVTFPQFEGYVVSSGGKQFLHLTEERNHANLEMLNILLCWAQIAQYDSDGVVVRAENVGLGYAVNDICDALRHIEKSNFAPSKPK